MEREIKFRGRTKDGEWLKGSLVQFAEKCSIVSKEEIENTPLDFVGAAIIKGVVEAETVGQYTGCRDKDGEEIYEGDILKFYDDIYFIVEVCYSDNTSAFMIEEHPSDGNLEYLGGQDTTCSLIIGNIYDNPELIKK